MLNHFKNITSLNIALIISIVILSMFTVSWHHQNYLLYKKSKTVNTENKKIIALSKQLQTEYSEQISGKEIQDKALKELQMKIPKSIKEVFL